MNAAYYYKPRNRKGRAARRLLRLVIKSVCLFLAFFVLGMALAYLVITNQPMP